jgi:hypothetical protein
MDDLSQIGIFTGYDMQCDGNLHVELSQMLAHPKCYNTLADV